MMNKSTDKTLRAANSDTRLITKRRVRVLAVSTRSRVNFFSFNPSLMLFNFCSVSAMHKVLQCPKIWLWLSLWFWKLPIGMLEWNTCSHNTNFIYQLQIDRFVNFFNEITSNWSINFSSREFHFDCAWLAHFDQHIFGVLGTFLDQSWHANCMFNRTFLNTAENSV